MEDLSPDTRQLIENRIKANEGITGDYEKDAAKGLFQEFKPTQYDFGLNAQNDAIARKAKAKFYDPVLENLQTQQKAEYAGQAQKQLQRGQKMALGQLRYDNARSLAAQQRLAQEEAQRAQMIGSLFQVAGVGAGAFFGGPAGAAVGGQAGSAVGNSVSGGPAAQSRLNMAGRTA